MRLGVIFFCVVAYLVLGGPIALHGLKERARLVEVEGVVVAPDEPSAVSQTTVRFTWHGREYQVPMGFRKQHVGKRVVVYCDRNEISNCHSGPVPDYLWMVLGAGAAYLIALGYFAIRGRIETPVRR